LPMTRHHCNLDVWASAQSSEDGHRSLVTSKRALSEYNEGLILMFCPFICPDQTPFVGNFKTVINYNFHCEIFPATLSKVGSGDDTVTTCYQKFVQLFKKIKKKRCKASLRFSK